MGLPAAISLSSIEISTVYLYCFSADFFASFLRLLSFFYIFHVIIWPNNCILSGNHIALRLRAVSTKTIFGFKTRNTTSRIWNRKELSEVVRQLKKTTRNIKFKLWRSLAVWYLYKREIWNGVPNSFLSRRKSIYSTVVCLVNLCPRVIMSSVAVQVMPSVTNFSKDSLITNKLASDLDAKLVSSSKKVLLQRIEFKPASKPDEQYENLRKKYVPANSPSTNHANGHCKEQLRSPDKNSNEEMPSPKLILFPVENVELYWKQVRRVGPGLSNMGNTCFLNSVLQVLTYTAPLVNYLASKAHSEKCKCSTG